MKTGLLICNVCQRGVSSDAVTCPGCAAALSEKRLSSTGVTLMVGTLMTSLLACLWFGPLALLCGGAFGIGIAILGAIGAMSENAPLSGALRLGKATDAERLEMPLSAFATAVPRETNRYLGTAIIALILTGTVCLARPSEPPLVVDAPTTTDPSTDSSSDEPSDSAPAPAPAVVSAPAAPGSSWYCACVVEQADEGEVMVTACRRDEAACHRLATRAREAGGTMLRLELDCMGVAGDDTEPTSLGAAGGWVASARAGGTQLVGECVLPVR